MITLKIGKTYVGNDAMRLCIESCPVGDAVKETLTPFGYLCTYIKLQWFLKNG
jgi:hypothetical protein